MAKLQNDYDILKNENQLLQKKLDSKSDKYVNLATLLAEAYEKITKEETEKDVSGKNFELDMEEMFFYCFKQL